MRKLRITQQNCRKSKTVALGLINSVDPTDWDIVLLQEPYIYPNSHLTIASPRWNVIYPTASSNHAPPSSLILVNSNIRPSTIMQIPIPSPLIMAVTVQTEAETH